jgi:hypothetical protein
MPLLIELQEVTNFRRPVTICVDDVLLISGVGGRITSGSSVELGGAVCSSDGGGLGRGRYGDGNTGQDVGLGSPPWAGDFGDRQRRSLA